MGFHRVRGVLHGLIGIFFFNSPELLVLQVPNARLIADSLAQSNFDVYLPDLFAGSVIPPEAVDAVAGKFQGIGTSLMRGVKLMLAVPTVVNILAFRSKACAEDVDKGLAELKGRYKKVRLSSVRVKKFLTRLISVYNSNLCLATFMSLPRTRARNRSES